LRRAVVEDSKDERLHLAVGLFCEGLMAAEMFKKACQEDDIHLVLLRNGVKWKILDVSLI
jgi:hypothetical protein